MKGPRCPRHTLLCGDCGAVIRAGSPDLEPVYGCCLRCRGRRGAAAARHIYEIHGHGFGRVAGRSKA